MPTDREILKLAQAGQIGSSGCAADPLVTVKALHTRVYNVPVSNIVQSSGAIASVIEYAAFRVPFACRVLSCYVTAPIAVANAASNIVTFNVARERAAVSTSIATADTTTTTGVAFATGLAAFVPKAMTLSATSANLDLAAGDAVTISAIKGASGVLINGLQTFCMVSITVEENGV